MAYRFGHEVPGLLGGVEIAAIRRFWQACRAFLKLKCGVGRGQASKHRFQVALLARTRPQNCPDRPVISLAISVA